MTAVKAEARKLEAAEHAADGGKKLEGVVVNGRIGVPDLEANDQPNDQIEACDHKQQGRGLLVHDPQDRKDDEAERADDAERRQERDKRSGERRRLRDGGADRVFAAAQENDVADDQTACAHDQKKIGDDAGGEDLLPAFFFGQRVEKRDQTDEQNTGQHSQQNVEYAAVRQTAVRQKFGGKLLPTDQKACDGDAEGQGEHKPAG